MLEIHPGDVSEKLTSSALLRVGSGRLKKERKKAIKIVPIFGAPRGSVVFFFFLVFFPEICRGGASAPRTMRPSLDTQTPYIFLSPNNRNRAIARLPVVRRDKKLSFFVEKKRKKNEKITFYSLNEISPLYCPSHPAGEAGREGTDDRGRTGNAGMEHGCRDQNWSNAVKFSDVIYVDPDVGLDKDSGRAISCKDLSPRLQKPLTRRTRKSVGYPKLEQMYNGFYGI